MAAVTPRQSFNSHWEVESHWTSVAWVHGQALSGVSIPIGKLSLIGQRREVTSHPLLDLLFQFPLGS